MIRIIKDNLSELEKRQMETISSLQDKINLLEFDISQLKKQKQILKRSLFDRKETTKIAIKELEHIRKEECYNTISNVLVTLNSSLRERQ
jgi:hypothetical protein